MRHEGRRNLSTLVKYQAEVRHVCACACPSYCMKTRGAGPAESHRGEQKESRLGKGVPQKPGTVRLHLTLSCRNVSYSWQDMLIIRTRNLTQSSHSQLEAEKTEGKQHWKMIHNNGKHHKAHSSLPAPHGCMWHSWTHAWHMDTQRHDRTYPCGQPSRGKTDEMIPRPARGEAGKRGQQRGSGVVRGGCSHVGRKAGRHRSQQTHGHGGGDPRSAGLDLRKESGPAP